MTTQQLLLAASKFKASGGVITTEGDYTVHTFTSNGDFIVESGSKAINYLIIGGGGTGFGSIGVSGTIGPGGGAGDYVPKLNKVIGGGIYPVVVAGVKIGPSYGSLNGDSSSFNGDVAIGGGGGNQAGASGGGAIGRSPGQFGAGAAATGIQGNKGGDHTSAGGWAAGGGGGCAPAGVGVGGNNSGNTGGVGGYGYQDPFWMSSYYFCGGGGGASESGVGGYGRGGGGNGASGSGGAGGDAPNYGCGGGGSRNNSGSGGKGGNGGAGIVIIKYLTN